MERKKHIINKQNAGFLYFRTASLISNKVLYIAILVVFIFSSPISNASNKTKIYEAYINNNMEKWEDIIKEMNANQNMNNNSRAELLNYQYGYIGYCIGMEEWDKAKKHLSNAEENLEILENKNFNPSTINAYKSAFYGFKIGLSPVKAAFFGPKSVKFSKLAIKQDEKNPMGYIQYGNSQFYMPAVFGGSKEVAIDYFKMAQNLFENNLQNLKDDWNYLSLLTLIAQSFDEINQLEEAKKYYKKILTIEPEFQWVKDELYPELLKKISKNNE